MTSVSHLPVARSPHIVGTESALSTRSRVEKLAERRLRESSYRALRNVRCNYHEGVLTLRGCLRSYYLKQVAQSVVARIEGVELVNNRVEVNTEERRGA